MLAIRWSVAALAVALLCSPAPPMLFLALDPTRGSLSSMVPLYAVLRTAIIATALAMAYFLRREYAGDARRLAARLGELAHLEAGDRRPVPRRQLVIAATILALYAGNAFALWRQIPPRPGLDGRTYEPAARQLRQHGNLDGQVFRTPGYPLILAAFMDERGDVRLAALSLFQTTLLVASAAMFAAGLVALLGLSPVFAAAAAAVFFSQPHLIALAQLEASDVPALFCALAATGCFLLDFERATVSRLTIAAGVAATVLALLRPQYYFLPIVVLAAYALAGRWKKGVVFAVVPAFFLGGWLLRNYVCYGLAGPAASAAAGVKEHILDQDFAKHARFPGVEDSDAVRRLRALPADSEAEEKSALFIAAVDQAIAPAVAADPRRQETIRLRYMKDVLRSGLQTPEGRRIFLTAVWRGICRNLEAGVGFWQSHAAVVLHRERPVYYHVSSQFVESTVRLANPALFWLSTAFMGALLVRLGRRRRWSRLERMAVFLWVVLAANTALSAVADVPATARYNAAALPLFPLLYLAEAMVICGWARVSDGK